MQATPSYPLKIQFNPVVIEEFAITKLTEANGQKDS